IYQTFSVLSSHKYTVSGSPLWSVNTSPSGSWQEIWVSPAGNVPTNGCDFPTTTTCSTTGVNLYKSDNTCATTTTAHAWKANPHSCITNNGGADYTLTPNAGVTSIPLVIKLGSCASGAYTCTINTSGSNPPVMVTDQGAVVGRVIDSAGT